MGVGDAPAARFHAGHDMVTPALPRFLYSSILFT
jgi:hypothetical protein